ncbi:MAG: hypothetical protein AAF353_10420 [Pseudomonadota bacterium]
MKKKPIFILIAITMATSFALVFSHSLTLPEPLIADHEPHPPLPAARNIRLALLLDTSNSMDGLIDQTRNQLWQVVNEFASAKQNGMTPELEIALFEYGNDNNSAPEGYVRKLSSFTQELDAVSEGLFTLTTSGGSEFCGYAIQDAVTELQWSQSDSDIKTIFIAGNESFAQGPVSFREAIKLAGTQGITVNTIHAGGHETGIHDNWQTAAQLAGGDYLSIDADQQIVHINAPQDEEIAALNAELNQTYIPYGNEGVHKLERQMKQDAESSGISSGLLAKRAMSKSSSFYKNSKWDLVDALEEGEINEDSISELDDDTLPTPMKDMDGAGRLEYVQQKAAARASIKQRIAELSESRKAFVAEKKKELSLAAPSVSDALTQAVQKEAQAKNFVFE